MSDAVPKAASTRSTLAILATRIAMFPLSFVVSIFVAVDLEAAGFGLFHFLNLFAGPVLHVLSFGVGGGVTYLVSNGSYRPSEVLSTCVLAGAGIGLFAAGLVGGLWSMGWLGVIGNSVTAELLWPVLAAMVLQAELQILYRLAMGASWFTVMNAVDLGKAVLMPSLLFLFVIVAGLGVQGAVYAILANAACLVVFLLYLVLRRCGFRPRLSGRFIREGAHYGTRAWAGDVAAQAYNRLDHLLFGFLASESLLGIYNIATRITELLWVPTTALSPVLFNRIASETEQRERVYLIGQNHRVIIFLVVLGALALAASLGWLIPVLYQGKFDDAVTPALILIPGTVLMVTQKVLTKYFSGTGRPGISSAITVVGALLIGALALVLIPRYGPEGAAAASTIAYTVMALASIAVYRRLIAPARPRLFTIGRADLRWVRLRIGEALGFWKHRWENRLRG